MHARTNPRLKICCIASIDEARLALDHGAHALGLVSAMPSGPGPIDDAAIAEIAAWAPPAVSTFLLTCLVEPRDIVEQVRTAGVDTVQLVDRVDPAAYAVLRAGLPGVKLVQVVHVRDESSVREAEAVARHVDAVLLDSGNPSAPVKELGGTGRVHDWTLSRRIRERLEVPVFLAGGLHAGNAREAVAAVAPYGLDLCSGVRSDGRLDRSKLAAFVAAATGGAAAGGAAAG